MTVDEEIVLNQGLYLIPVKVVNRFIVAMRLLAGLLATGATAMGVRLTQVTDFKNARFTALDHVPGWPETWGVALAMFGIIVLVSRAVDHHYADAVSGFFSVACGVWYCIFAASIYIGGGQYAYTIYSAVAGLHFVMGWLLWKSAGLRPKHVKGVVVQ